LSSHFLSNKSLKIKIYRTIILPVVFYGCETRSLTVKEEHRLKVRKIFGPKSEEMAGGWRRLHNEELHNLQTSPNIIRVIKSRRMRWAGHVACMGKMRNMHKISENQKGEDHLDDFSVDGKIIED
jgi:hypothetical protein